LADYLKETHGIEAAAGGGVVMAAAPAEAVEEKTEFDIVLVECGAKKMDVLKAIRTITGLGLKEAKDLVEKANSMVKEAAPKADAEKIKKELEDLGAKVALK
jgi:large subunit ribosomal protein L7/L12